MRTIPSTLDLCNVRSAAAWGHRFKHRPMVPCLPATSTGPLGKRKILSVDQDRSADLEAGADTELQNNVPSAVTWAHMRKCEISPLFHSAQPTSKRGADTVQHSVLPAVSTAHRPRFQRSCSYKRSVCTRCLVHQHDSLLLSAQTPNMAGTLPVFPIPDPRFPETAYVGFIRSKNAWRYMIAGDPDAH